MNPLDDKIDILCSISYLNETILSLPNLSSSSQEETREADRKIEEAYQVDGYEKMKMPLDSFALLTNEGHYDFVLRLLETIHSLSLWVNQRMYLNWEEDDVAFLSFLLHHRTLYSDDMISAHRPLLRLLMKEALIPFFLDSKPEDPFFDDINGKSLDAEQRKAILKPERRSLVVAGAGSGKTLTICGKVKYLIEKKEVDPEDILLLSYSKKSAEDLQKKVHLINPNLKAATFHSVGLEILEKSKGKRIAVEDQFNAIVESYFREEIFHHPEQVRDILFYHGLYLNDDTSKKKFKDEGELYEDLESEDLTTLKDTILVQQKAKNSKETLKKEKVKSYEELMIANWYYLNGISYTYEKPYEINVSTPEHRQYLPDFTLNDYHVYHEHYGIGKDGKATQFGEEQSTKYLITMAWKRKLHAEHQTDCIETYSYEFQDGTIFDHLEKEMKKRHIPLHPLSEQEAVQTMHSIYHGYSFLSFINVVKSFLSLYKARYSDEKGFEELPSLPNATLFEKQREQHFLKIVKEVYLYYESKRREEGKIDFDDMILSSIKALDSMEGFRYKEILVDEFQDISYSRMLFLRKLLEHGNGNLFAVGDDWQSIYRFAGSDLDIFLHFEKYFGKYALSKITTTHRNSQELQDIVGPFIRKNPGQIAKSISSPLHLDHPVRVMFYSSDKQGAFLSILKDIEARDPQANVLLLGRNKIDIKYVLENPTYYYKKPFDQVHSEEITIPAFAKMHLRFSTVHAAKGMEEDYVVLLNANDDRLGFPNKIEDDVLLQLVLSSKSNYPYEEERRLFYVALTRTRKYVYILANREHPSIFLKEILSQCQGMNSKQVISNEACISCPRCHSGRLVLRQDKRGNQFYRCSHYPYCDYHIQDLEAVKRNKRCPECGDFLVKRYGKHGPFYGCHNYPNCLYTEDLGKK